MKKIILAGALTLCLSFALAPALTARAQTLPTGCTATSSITEPACASLVAQLQSLIATLIQEISTLQAQITAKTVPITVLPTPIPNRPVITYPSAPIVTLTASPSVITAGQSANLNATISSNVTICYQNGQTTALGFMSPETATPSKTTTYTLTCSNSTGQSASASATITVIPATTPTPPTIPLTLPGVIPTVTLSANPAVITAGQSTYLYATNNLYGALESKCYLNGQQTALGGGPNGSGMGPAIISPTQTTTYTYTCVNSSGQSASVSASVTVIPATTPTPTPTNPLTFPSVAPTVSLVASPSVITAGQSSTLFLGVTDSTGVSSCSLNNQALSLPFGSQSVSPSQSTTYTLTCTNTAGKSASVSTTVGVIPATTFTPNPLVPPVTIQPPTVAPSLTVSADTTSIVSGANTPVHVSWQSTGATACYGTQGWSGVSIGLTGSSLVSPSQTSTYIVTCNNSAGQSIAKSVTVTVTPIPYPTATLSASPTTVSAGQPVTLSWSSTDSYACYGVNSWATGTNGPVRGSATVYPSQSTTYQVSCYGNNGTIAYSSASVSVSATQTQTTSSTNTGGTTSTGGTTTNGGTGGTTTCPNNEITCDSAAAAIYSNLQTLLNELSQAIAH